MPSRELKSSSYEPPADRDRRGRGRGPRSQVGSSFVSIPGSRNNLASGVTPATTATPTTPARRSDTSQANNFAGNERRGRLLDAAGGGDVAADIEEEFEKENNPPQQFVSPPPPTGNGKKSFQAIDPINRNVDV